MELILAPRSARSAIVARLDRLDANRIITVGIALAIVGIVGQIVTQLVDFEALGLRIAVLNSDVHASIFGVLSIAAQAAAAAAVGIRAIQGPRRRRWALLAALLVALLAVRVALPDDPAALAAPLAVVLVMLVWLTLADQPRARRTLYAALLLLSFSFLVHVVGLKIVNGLGYGYNSLPYELKGILKHSTELSGWLLIATAVLAGCSLAMPGAPRSRREP